MTTKKIKQDEVLAAFYENFFYENAEEVFKGIAKEALRSDNVKFLQWFLEFVEDKIDFNRPTKELLEEKTIEGKLDLLLKMYLDHDINLTTYERLVNILKTGNDIIISQSK